MNKSLPEIFETTPDNSQSIDIGLEASFKKENTGEQIIFRVKQQNDPVYCLLFLQALTNGSLPICIIFISTRSSA
jgi:hypothetical protein